MCRSMVDIHSATAEIRRGKKKKEDRWNHRAAATFWLLIFWHHYLNKTNDYFFSEVSGNYVSFSVNYQNSSPNFILFPHYNIKQISKKYITWQIDKSRNSSRKNRKAPEVHKLWNECLHCICSLVLKVNKVKPESYCLVSCCFKDLVSWSCLQGNCLGLGLELSTCRLVLITHHHHHHHHHTHTHRMAKKKICTCKK